MSWFHPTDCRRDHHRTLWYRTHQITWNATKWKPFQRSSKQFLTVSLTWLLTYYKTQSSFIRSINSNPPRCFVLSTKLPPSSLVAMHLTLPLIVIVNQRQNFKSCSNLTQALTSIPNWHRLCTPTWKRMWRGFFAVQYWSSVRDPRRIPCWV